MAVAYKLDKNWKRLQQMLEPGKVDKIARRHLQRATRLNAKIAEKKIRDTIKSGGFVENRPLTVALKGDNKPLVGPTAQLWGAITSRLVDDRTAFVGVLKTSANYNIAVAIHEGVAIAVTAKMRGLFFVLWQASIGRMPVSELAGRAGELWSLMPGGWKPLLPSTKVILIPARQFIREAFGDKEIRELSRANWQAALKAAFAEIKAGVK